MIIVYKDRTVPFESTALEINYDRNADCYYIKAYIGDKHFAVKTAIPTYCDAKLVLRDIVAAYKRGDKIYEA